MTQTNDLHYRLPAGATLLFWLAVLIGGITLVAGFVLVPERAWVDLLAIGNYLIGLSLGGLLLVALFYVTGARWSLPVRRVPEAMATVLPLAAVPILVVLFLRPSLYSWTVSLSAEGYVSPLKHLWLNRPFFLVRAVVYIALWLAFAGLLVRNSRREDLSPSTAPRSGNVGLSALFLVVFGITCWLASYDWIMSLEPDWASTIFGVYQFSGLFLSGLAAVVLVVIWLQRRSQLGAVLTAAHLHDLGTLLFAFSNFWMYTWFCQYMLIWFVDNPEETSYLRLRWQGNWPGLLFADLALNWAIPFAVLLFRPAKRNPRVLGGVAIAILLGRWVDLSLMIMPSQGDALALPGLLELGLLVGMVGVFVLVVFRGLGKAPLVPLDEWTS